jgi:hypothetical protein
VDIIASIHHFILFSFFFAFVFFFFCPFFCASSSSLFIMGDVPVPASSALLAIVRRREEAEGVSNVLDSLGCLPPQPASGLDDEHDEDDVDDDNKGRASGVPSWKLVARSWSEKKANKKEQVSEEQEDMEEVVEFPNQEEEEDNVSEESDPDFVPPVADDDQGQKAAIASAPHLIPTKKKQRKSSVVNLYTNGLDPPKFNLLHKAQQPVSADAPGFREAMDGFVVPPQLMYLYQNCLAKPKDSFFISASVHIHVISHACGLTTKDMLKMRGWFF